MNGSERIAKERKRQIEVEGWNSEHDGNHGDDLAWAAVCYAAPGPVFESQGVDPWPWESGWDKRKKHDRIRQLEIAGALIAAEIDRLLRLQREIVLGRYNE